MALLSTVAVTWSATASAAVLTQADVALALYASSDGATWKQLSGTTLSGFFGPHRCACPDTLSVQLQLTTSGQTNIGNSTVSVNFLLGQNCLATASSCVSLGQVSFSAAVSATSPRFDSALVYTTAHGAAVDCSALIAGATTLWAVIAQDGVTLPFVLTLDVPVTIGTVGAPSGVTAQPANEGLLVSWTAPKDASLVAGYQVLCLPQPATPSEAGYETCGLATGVNTTTLTPGDVTQVCSPMLPVTSNSIRVTGLKNETLYSVAVIAIDPSGAVSAVSPSAQGTPQPTVGFIDKYKEAGGAATGCSVARYSRSNGVVLLPVLGVALVALRRGARRRHRRGRGLPALLPWLLLVIPTQAHAQEFAVDRGDEWGDAGKSAPHMFQPPDWGFEFGLSMYRPAVDSEFDGKHPYRDTFGSGRHMMWQAGVERYLLHRIGTLGVALRAGYYKVTARAFLDDGVSRSGDDTALQLIPLVLSAVYKANGLPGLRRVPITPYAKAGLNGVFWRAMNTGAASVSGFSPGWHVAGGVMLGLNWLGDGVVAPNAIADPGALFFEWDYAAINGLGLSDALRVGDNTWYAGIMFDL